MGSKKIKVSKVPTYTETSDNEYIVRYGKRAWAEIMAEAEAELDKERNRWRSGKRPQYVVYQRDDGSLVIFDEMTAEIYTLKFDEASNPDHHYQVREVAAEYRAKNAEKVEAHMLQVSCWRGEKRETFPPQLLPGNFLEAFRKKLAENKGFTHGYSYSETQRTLYVTHGNGLQMTYRFTAAVIGGEEAQNGDYH